MLAMAIHDQGMHACLTLLAGRDHHHRYLHGNARIIDITLRLDHVSPDRNDIVIVAGIPVDRTPRT